MNELQWPPHRINRLTLTQAECLVRARPPGDPGPVTSLDEYRARLDAERAELDEWGGP